MAFGSMWYSMSLNPCLLVFCSKAQTMYLVVTCTTCTTSYLLLSISFVLLYACVHRWWSVVRLFLLPNVGRTQCLSLVCWGWPSCCCSIPCSQNGGPPLWLWWWWIHSLALGIPHGSAVHGGVPLEILWIWCESKGQGWPILCSVYCMLFSNASKECLGLCPFTSVTHYWCDVLVWILFFFPPIFIIWMVISIAPWLVL